MKKFITRKNILFVLFIILFFIMLNIIFPQKMDIELYSEKYYNTFSPLLKYDCVYEIDLNTMKLNKFEGDPKKHFKNATDSLFVTDFVTHNFTILKHMKNKKVFDISFFREEGFIQVWYHDFVVEISYDSINKTIKKEVKSY